jgi:uncharacterized protein (TIGR00369 family)
MKRGPAFRRGTPRSPSIDCTYQLDEVNLFGVTDRAERDNPGLGADEVDAAVVERVRASFARQGAMKTLGADLAVIAVGHVAIALPIEPRLSQQNGFLHAGVVVAALDSACGYAAMTLMPADAEVLSVEFKVNLLAPASSDRLFAEGQVVRAGGTLTVCRGDAYAEQESERVHVATMLATMVRRRAG